MSEHWAANSPDPIAQAARAIIWARYDGAPPWRTPIPDAEWDAAVEMVREDVRG